MLSSATETLVYSSEDFTLLQRPHRVQPRHSQARSAMIGPDGAVPCADPSSVVDKATSAADEAASKAKNATPDLSQGLLDRATKSFGSVTQEVGVSGWVSTDQSRKACLTPVPRFLLGLATPAARLTNTAAADAASCSPGCKSFMRWRACNAEKVTCIGLSPP